MNDNLPKPKPIGALPVLDKTLCGVQALLLRLRLRSFLNVQEAIPILNTLDVGSKQKRQNKHTKDLTVTKDLNDLEDQDSKDVNRRNCARVARDSQEGNHNKTGKMTTRIMEKLRNYHSIGLLMIS